MKTIVKGLSILFCFQFFGCQTINENYQEDVAQPDYLHRSMKKLTDIIVHDIFSPPVASRNYAYPSIAAYEAMVPSDPSFTSFAGQLHELTELPKPDPNLEYSFPVASVQAFTITGKSFIFSEEMMDDFRDEVFAEIRSQGIPRKVMENSLAYGEQIANHILSWADKDNYKQTRTFPKYSITNDDERWQPTPPDYMDGIEPHWNKIRPFIIDSAEQFVPKPPTAFSTDKSSQFYKEAIEVYEAVEPDPEDRKAIASFWDCNPYVSHHKGHVMFATKKITPGGHWIGITAIASKQAGSNFIETTEAYAMVSIALADAFISCWDEKYRSNLVRPETYINRYIDEDWLPVLQTPPFPEHTSGHSVISSAAGEVLTKLFGDNFSFVDTVEEEYGLPARSFGSFREAYQEAAISRLYGGIHYMPAITYGVEQGQQLGNFILEKVSTRQDQIGMLNEEVAK